MSYTLRNHANDDEWEEIKVIFNGSPEYREVNVKKGEWLVVAHDGNISPDGKLGTEKGGKILVEPYSALILARQ